MSLPDKSVRVTLDIPAEAAEQLRKLLSSSNNEKSFAELGISSLQVQGSPAVKFKVPLPDISPNKASSTPPLKSRDKPSSVSTTSAGPSLNASSSNSPNVFLDPLSSSVKEMQNRLLKLGAINRKMVQQQNNALTSQHNKLTRDSSTAFLDGSTKKFSSSPLLVNLLRQESGEAMLGESDNSSDLLRQHYLSSSSSSNKKISKIKDMKPVKDRNGGSNLVFSDKRSHGVDLNRMSNSSNNLFKMKPGSEKVNQNSSSLLNNLDSSEKSAVRLKLKLPLDKSNSANNEDSSTAESGSSASTASSSQNGTSSDRKIPKLILSVKDRTIREARINKQRIAEEKNKALSKVSDNLMLSTKLGPETILEKVQSATTSPNSTMSPNSTISKNDDSESKSAVKRSLEKSVPSIPNPNKPDTSNRKLQPNGENHDFNMEEVKTEARSPKRESPGDSNHKEDSDSTPPEKKIKSEPQSPGKNGDKQETSEVKKEGIKAEIKKEPAVNVVAPPVVSQISSTCNGGSPSNLPSSITVTPSSKMVPVKLVTVSGEGNVRLVRVSPVKSKHPEKSSSLEITPTKSTSASPFATKSTPTPSTRVSSLSSSSITSSTSSMSLSLSTSSKPFSPLNTSATSTKTATMSTSATPVPSSPSTACHHPILSSNITIVSSSEKKDRPALPRKKETTVGMELARALSISKPPGLEITRLHNGVHKDEDKSSATKVVVSEDPLKNLKAAQQAALNEITSGAAKAKTIRLQKQMEPSASINSIVSKAMATSTDSSKVVAQSSAQTQAKDRIDPTMLVTDESSHTSESSFSITNAKKFNCVSTAETDALVQMRLSLAKQQLQAKSPVTRPQLKRKITSTTSNSGDDQQEAARTANDSQVTTSSTVNHQISDGETRISTRSTKLVDPQFSKRRKT